MSRVAVSTKEQTMAAKKRYYEAYAGLDMRRRMEAEDSMMIKSDPSAPAGLPQKEMIKFYPKADYASYPDLDDTLRGVDKQMKSDSGKEKKGKFPEKY